MDIAKILTGKKVTVFRADTTKEALVLGIDEECRLIVEYDSGEKEALLSGEVSTKIKNKG